MAKTEETKRLEREIWAATHKMGVFCCYEVTIGWFGKERVDYMTYDTKGVFRCYEIKISTSDFHSKARNSFVGHFNYYVLTQTLYEAIKNEIPSHIGVYIGEHCIKKAKRQSPTEDEQTLKNSMIRSLSREVEKHIASNNPHAIETLKRQRRELERENVDCRRQYWDLRRKVEEKYGRNWDREC